VNGRPYLSIGQVLDLLKQEFPDLTISKIRFLESQGLLDPERTPSGYRKFYDPDVERLRYILRAQQEQYLPLKVIKGRLGTDDDGEPEPVEAPSSGARVRAAAPAAPTPVRAAAAAARGPSAAAEDLGTSRHPSGVAPKATPPAVLRAVTEDEVEVESDEGPATLTIEEIATVSGLTVADISELERFGLIAGKRIAGTTYYDGDCVTIAGVAARFRSFGVEARHLRMYRTAVEREAGFFEQVVTPMLKQRNPQARRQAVETLLEMSRLGSALRDAVLRLALREYTGGS